MDGMKEHEWQEVSKGSPCPICEKDSWCRVTIDGVFAACRRQSKGGEPKSYADGTAYFLHVLKDTRVPNLHKPRSQKRVPKDQRQFAKAANNTPRDDDKTKERASIEVLNHAYSTLLSYEFVALSDEHQQAMLARGFTAENIAWRQYRSMPGNKAHLIAFKARIVHDLGVAGTVGVPGLAGSNSGLPCGGGIIVPCRNAAGQIFAIKIRCDDNAKHEDLPKYYYLSSGKHGGPTAAMQTHVPLGTPAEVNEVRVTEGEIKADLATDISGMPTLSFPGVSSWRTILPTLERLKVEIVRIAFDADCNKNLHVATAQSDCAKELRTAGYTVKVERWSITDGKGIDDVLVAGGAIEVLEGDDASTHIDCCLQLAQQAEEEARAAREAANPSLLKRALDTYAKGVAEFFADEALLYELAKVACTDPPQYAAICEELRSHGLGTMNFRRAMKPILAKAAAEVEPEIGRADKGGFFTFGGQICRTRQTPYGPLTMPLCNFMAEIVDETTLDDGAELKVVLGIEGSLMVSDEEEAVSKPLSRIEVPAEKFYEPQRWILPGWGSGAIAWPGEIKALPAAIQALSTNKKLSRVYTHTGWRKFGDQWGYLHAGGAIGVDAEVRVALPDSLSHMELPLPASSSELREAILASLDILQLMPGNKATTFSLLGTVYRSPLGLADHSLYLLGRTGTYKTESAALGMMHYGVGFDSRHLPASWSSTGNALEGLLFHAKDMPVVIDDFAPQAGDVARLNRSAEQVFRAQGNSAGRGRMKHDGTLRQPKPPRGTVIATGEDVPSGQSILARLNIQEFSPGDVDLAHLTKCQENGARGLFARAMAGYIAWIAPNYEAVMAAKKTEVASLRAKAIEAAKDSGQHARAPGIVAEVFYGLQMFFSFALENEAITPAHREQLEAEAWDCLLRSSATQANGQDEFEPAAQFVAMLTSSIATGRAHLVSIDGTTPNNAESWGWRRIEIPLSTGGYREEWRAGGRKIGWMLDSKSLLLDPNAAYSAAQQLAEETGTGFAIRPVTLGKRLNEKGLLIRTGKEDGGRETLKVRCTCEGRRVQGFEMRLETLCPTEDPTPGEDAIPADLGGDGQQNQKGQVFYAVETALKQEKLVIAERVF